MRKLKLFFRNLTGLIKSLCHLAGKAKNLKIFYGFWHWEIAKKYANKRFNKYSSKLDQQGKSQGVFAYSEDSLIVISQKEIKHLKKVGFLTTPKWHRKIFNKENLYKVS